MVIENWSHNHKLTKALLNWVNCSTWLLCRWALQHVMPEQYLYVSETGPFLGRIRRLMDSRRATKTLNCSFYVTRKYANQLCGLHYSVDFFLAVSSRRKRYRWTHLAVNGNLGSIAGAAAGCGSELFPAGAELELFFSLDFEDDLDDLDPMLYVMWHTELENTNPGKSSNNPAAWKNCGLWPQSFYTTIVSYPPLLLWTFVTMYRILKVNLPISP